MVQKIYNIFYFSDKHFLILGGSTSGSYANGGRYVNGSHFETEVIDVSSSSSSSPFGDIPSRRRYSVGGILISTPILCGGGGFPFPDEDSCISFKNSQWTKTHEMTTKRVKCSKCTIKFQHTVDPWWIQC